MVFESVLITHISSQCLLYESCRKGHDRLDYVYDTQVTS